jgi:hypothetical protein
MAEQTAMFEEEQQVKRLGGIITPELMKEVRRLEMMK